MWREERVWKLCLLQSGHVSGLAIRVFSLLSKSESRLIKSPVCVCVCVCVCVGPPLITLNCLVDFHDI
jgi:hypothetical protein